VLQHSHGACWAVLTVTNTFQKCAMPSDTSAFEGRILCMHLCCTCLLISSAKLSCIVRTLTSGKHGYLCVIFLQRWPSRAPACAAALPERWHRRRRSRVRVILSMASPECQAWGQQACTWAGEQTYILAHEWETKRMSKVILLSNTDCQASCICMWPGQAPPGLVCAFENLQAYSD
jgi:hypothetical protein